MVESFSQSGWFWTPCLCANLPTTLIARFFVDCKVFWKARSVELGDYGDIQKARCWYFGLGRDLENLSLKFLCFGPIPCFESTRQIGNEGECTWFKCGECTCLCSCTRSCGFKAARIFRWHKFAITQNVEKMCCSNFHRWAKTFRRFPMDYESLVVSDMKMSLMSSRESPSAIKFLWIESGMVKFNYVLSSWWKDVV